jgi:hypothetical protein
VDRYDAEVLAVLEQELLAPAVRRLRRRFCAAVAVAATTTVAGLALVGLAVLPVLYLVLVTGGLVLVSRTTEPPGRPATGRARHGARRPRRQPLGCSTKS